MAEEQAERLIALLEQIGTRLETIEAAVTRIAINIP